MGEYRYVGQDALMARFIAELEPEIEEAADEVLTEVKRVTTPILSEALERSARTGPTRAATRQVSKQIIAGEGTDYGLIVHQKDAIHHKHGGAHFLSRPVVEYIPKLLERVAAAGRRSF